MLQVAKIKKKIELGRIPLKSLEISDLVHSIVLYYNTFVDTKSNILFNFIRPPRRTYNTMYRNSQ